MAGIIVQGQQLEAGIFRGAESAFDFMLVAQYLQLPGGHHEFVCHPAQMILLQDVAEDFKVLGFIHSGIFPDFIEVRENTPLACFVGNEGDAHGVNLGAEIGHAFRQSSAPFVQSAHSGFYVVHVAGLPCPSAAYRSPGIDVARVGSLPIVHEVADPRHPVARRFVAAGQHAKGRMVAIGLVHPACFFH